VLDLKHKHIYLNMYVACCLFGCFWWMFVGHCLCCLFETIQYWNKEFIMCCLKDQQWCCMWSR